MSTDTMPPTHPGEVLAEEFLSPLGVTANKLAVTISVPAIRISEIVRGLRSISADTALRLSAALGTTAQFWLNLQARYDLEVERDRMAPATLAGIKPLVGTA